MSLDELLFIHINQGFSSSGWSTFFSIATRLGNGYVLALLIVPSLFFLDRKRFREQLLPMVISVALGGLAVTVAKIAVDRPRPAEHFKGTDTEVHTPLGTPSDRSFPSGHTQTAFGAAAYLSCMYPAATPAFVVLAALVGLSRTALGVHFPSDVLVGAITGIVFALGVFFLNKRRLRRREPPC